MRQEPDFSWRGFYKEFAKKLLTFRDNRSELLEGIRTALGDKNFLFWNKKLEKEINFSEIDPFTVMALFNYKSTIETRITNAEKLAEIVGIDFKLPKKIEFDGIPTINILLGLFLQPYENVSGNLIRRDNTPEGIARIRNLWELFEIAVNASNSYPFSPETKRRFIRAFDASLEFDGIQLMTITAGLFWVNPEYFLPLDSNTIEYIKKLDIEDELVFTIDNQIKGSEYLDIIEKLRNYADEPDAKFPDFLNLSWAAWKVRNFDDEGCFLPIEKVVEIIKVSLSKGNMILQGPPGTGKTWLARRLAHALIDDKANNKISSVQFHPNISYEDFVRGYRPGKAGKLESVDGIFIEVAEQARKDSKNRYVIIIEEINRGNPAMIFGELLTLIEENKRSSEHSIKLACPDKEGKKEFFVPENLYIIGTMNIADRSLALVDLALRRRFAFVDLKPELGDPWLKWVTEKCNVNEEVAKDIQDRMINLNDTISNSQFLGKQFQIGHSHVTPSKPLDSRDVKNWFKQIAEKEILPLLKEYWYDSPPELEKAWIILTKDTNIFPKIFSLEISRMSLIQNSVMDLSEQSDEPGKKGYHKYITDKNIWLLLLYAFRELKDERLLLSKNMRWEDPPDEICLLVAKILSDEVEKRLRRQLNRDYVPTQAVLSRLRGRIDLLTTESRQLLQQGQIACQFHNFVFDTPRNRFVKSALDKSAALLLTFREQRQPKKATGDEALRLAGKCRQLARLMHEMGVLAPAPAPNSAELKNFGRHDATDRPVVELSKFVFALALPTEKGGAVPTPEIKKDERWFWNLFEKAVLGFFTIDPEVKEKGWIANGSGQDIEHKWPSENGSSRVEELLPKMIKDIILSNERLNRRIVIDTKFTNIIASRHHHGNRNRFKSVHLYQIYSYVMSQDEKYPDAEGVLLYPELDEEFDEHATIQGHRFRFVTVNLKADDSQVILEQLRRLVACHLTA